MSTALTVPEIASNVGITPEAWVALNQLYAGATPESVVLVAQYCKARKLDPLKKPVHIVPMSVQDSKTGKYIWRDVIMPGIQELRTTAARTMELAGQEEPQFGPAIKVQVNSAVSPDNKDARFIDVPEFCKVTIYRMVARTNDPAGPKERCAFTAIEYYEECCVRKKDGVINAMWQRRPHGQLAKCATAAALRSAFPEEAGGIMTAEEMAGREIDNDAIDGDFSVVSEAGSQEIPDPEAAEDVPARATSTAHLATKAANGKERKAEPEPKKEPEPKAEAKPSEKPYTRTNAAANHKIEVTGGPERVLRNMMNAKKIEDAQLLAAMNDSITMANINSAFDWIRQQPEQ
jgi:phage recombination protein Bet